MAHLRRGGCSCVTHPALTDWGTFCRVYGAGLDEMIRRSQSGNRDPFQRVIAKRSTGGCRLVRAEMAMEPAAPVSRFLYRGTV